MAKHIVSFSGGKDSTTMLLMMLEKGMQIDEIVFCDTKLEFPKMYVYIEKIKEYIKLKYDMNITTISAEDGWDEWFYRIKKRGKYIGTIYGFPMTLRAWCNDRIKMKPINNYYKKQGEHIRYIGIAYDEPKRYKRLEDNWKAPLYEWKIKESDCIDYLKEKGLHNPLYNKFNRLGCWCCPKQSLKSLRVLYREYPDLWKKLEKYQISSRTKFRIDYSVEELKIKFDKENEKQYKIMF